MTKRIFELALFCLLFVLNCHQAQAQNNVISKFDPKETVGKNIANNLDITGKSIYINKKIESVTIDTLNKVYVFGIRENEYFNRETVAVVDIESGNLLWERSYNFRFSDFTVINDAILLRTKGKTFKVDIKRGVEQWMVDNMFVYASTKLDIGIFYKQSAWSGKNLVEGIDLKTGKVLWNRKDLNFHGSRLIDVLSDSIVTVFERNSIQNINIKTGKGWQRNSLNMAQYCYSTANSTVCYNTSASLVDSTGYIITLSDRIFKLDKNGNEMWGVFYPNELTCTLPLLFERDSAYYLLNKGGGSFSQLLRFNESTSPFVSKYDKNGNEVFFTKFDKKQLITDALFYKNTLLTLHRKSLFKTNLTTGEVSFEYALKGKDKDEITDFIGLNTLIKGADNTFKLLPPADADGYHILDKDENIGKYSENLQLVKEYKRGEYWLFRGASKQFIFLKNVDNFVVLNRENLKLIAEFKDYKNGLVKDGSLFLSNDFKITKINLTQIHAN